MGTIVQYAISISLFIGIPVSIQWAVSKLTARRTALNGSGPDAVPVPQPIHD